MSMDCTYFVGLISNKGNVVVEMGSGVLENAIKNLGQIIDRADTMKNPKIFAGKIIGAYKLRQIASWDEANIIIKRTKIAQIKSNDLEKELKKKGAVLRWLN